MQRPVVGKHLPVGGSTGTAWFGISPQGRVDRGSDPWVAHGSHRECRQRQRCETYARAGMATRFLPDGGVEYALSSVKPDDVEGIREQIMGLGATDVVVKAAEL